MEASKVVVGPDDISVIVCTCLSLVVEYWPIVGTWVIVDVTTTPNSVILCCLGYFHLLLSPPSLLHHSHLLHSTLAQI